MDRSGLRAAAHEALALLFPVSCVACGVEGWELCARCGARLEPDPLIAPLTRTVAGVGEVVAALRYEGVVRAALLALKEDGRTGLAGRLAPALRAVATLPTLAGAPGTGVVLCPVPATRRSRRRRGFDPLRLLLTRAGLPATSLFRTASTLASQKQLSREERARNLEGAFVLSRPVTGFRVRLVDDVVTTGATLAETARALRAGGAEVLGAVALASTPRRDGRSPESLSESPGRFS